MECNKDLLKNDLADLRALFEHYYEDATIRYIPNLEEMNIASKKFTDFMEQVRDNPEVLGVDDSAVNEAQIDYLSEYAFAAFGVGYTLAKYIEKDTNAFSKHIESIMHNE